MASALIQVGVSKGGNSVTSQIEVRRAMQAVGLGATAQMEIDEIEPKGMGIWNITVSDMVWRGLKRQGHIEMVGGGYSIEAEMP